MVEHADVQARRQKQGNKVLRLEGLAARYLINHDLLAVTANCTHGPPDHCLAKRVTGAVSMASAPQKTFYQ